MWIDLIKMFGISLVLTIVLELFVALIWGLRTKRERLLVVLVNVLTNPAAVLIAWIVGMCFENQWDLLLQIPIESAVIFVEAVIYQQFSKAENWDIKHPIALAIVTNILSAMAGIMLQYIM